MTAQQPGGAHVVKRCAICAKFRAYEPDDQYCLVCGHDALQAECACGRGFEYALDESGDLYCPRCGRALRGRSPEFE